MWNELFGFFIGASFAYVVVRMPFLMFPRMRSWNEQFSTHPSPIPLDPHLIQRVLHMRMFFWSGLFFATLPLFLGWASLKYGGAAMGFGLWVVSGWTIISRIMSVIGDDGPPWTKQLAMRLQKVRNDSQSESPCCEYSLPVWEVTAVRCSTCRKVLLAEARPDLGRPRSDGWIKGTIRLLITDGRPVAAPLGEEE